MLIGQRILVYIQNICQVVDITDQQLAYNCLQHRMLKWWKKVVLCNLLEITMANAKVIYKKLGVGNYNNDTFRLAIIEGITGRL